MTPIERIEELLAEATPAPWQWWTSNSWRRLSHDGDGDVLCPEISRSDGHPDLRISESDMALIAALRNAAPALLRLVKAVGTIVWNHRDKHPDRQQDPIVALLFERRRWNDVVVALAELTKDEDQ